MRDQRVPAPYITILYISCLSAVYLSFYFTPFRVFIFESLQQCIRTLPFAEFAARRPLLSTTTTLFADCDLRTLHVTFCIAIFIDCIDDFIHVSRFRICSLFQEVIIEFDYSISKGKAFRLYRIWDCWHNRSKREDVRSKNIIHPAWYIYQYH